MLAAYAEKLGLDNPLHGLVVGERPEPSPSSGWEVISVRAASVNHHDVWTLRGATVVPVNPPVILGCDAAGVTADGREVIAYPVLGHGQHFYMLSDGVDGAFAERMAAPALSLVPKPRHLTFEEAAALPTAWLTAWSMLFRRGRLRPGERVLVQGARGGVSTAAVAIAAAAGAHVTVSSRDESALAAAKKIGAHAGVLSGEPLSVGVDVVIDTVGGPSFAHSIASARFGGRVVIAGGTGGGDVATQVRLLFRKELEIVGHKMGTLEEFEQLCSFLEHTGIRPTISRVYDGLPEVPTALDDMMNGRFFGKLVVRI